MAQSNHPELDDANVQAAIGIIYGLHPSLGDLDVGFKLPPEGLGFRLSTIGLCANYAKTLASGGIGRSDDRVAAAVGLIEDLMRRGRGREMVRGYRALEALEAVGVSTSRNDIAGHWRLLRRREQPLTR
ncbi:MAG: hypothetical protein HY053_02470 [Proteobacteria bacterium]|nr:hypothetical protein [Pseudomonadota bacterium]